MINSFLNTLKAHGWNFNEPCVILDVGARDSEQSVEFANAFPNAHIYSFECNPTTIPICRENSKHCDRIHLIEKAVHSFDGECTFYPTNKDKTITSWQDGNPGASSLFIATNKYPYETYVQDTITVPCARLDTVFRENQIERPQLVWMDLQGAEKIAFESMGDYLKEVKFIYLEITHKEMYKGQVLFPEMHHYLVANGFRILTPVNTNQWFEDAIYKRV